MTFQYNDGGRKAAGYKGTAGDCVTRAIAIALEKPYQEVYDALHEGGKELIDKGRCKVARRAKVRGISPRNGVFRKVYHKYLLKQGWVWQPTMHIGSGCKVHLKTTELPLGRIICRVSRHITAVIDGVINDTHNCSRGETRCVYGFYFKPKPKFLNE